MARSLIFAISRILEHFLEHRKSEKCSKINNMTDFEVFQAMAGHDR